MLFRYIVMVVHDYVQGVYEALSWIRALIMGEKSRCNPPPNHPPIQEGFDKVLREVDAALEDISKGAGKDFRQRLKVH